MSEHDIRILKTAVDGDGRSCVVGTEHQVLDELRDGTMWHGVLYATLSTPPPRPPGRGELRDVGVAPGELRWQVVDYGPGTGGVMHHTDTVDLNLILTGSMTLTLDDGPLTLRPGDAVVMNGVDHAWEAGPDGCRMGVMAIGTPPPA